MTNSACILCRGVEGDDLFKNLIATRYDLERVTRERDEARAEVESARRDGAEAMRAAMLAALARHIDATPALLAMVRSMPLGSSHG